MTPSGTAPGDTAAKARIDPAAAAAAARAEADTTAGTVGPVPVSTYRLQFTPAFRFEDARRIVPYLAKLGIDWLYASPYFKARPGSEHGYDIVDPNRLNPEIGTQAEFDALVGESQAHGLGHMVDFVPNHMGVGTGENWRWQDVLEWGEASDYADFFDIDWRPLRADMAGKVLVPFLGDYYGRALERGELAPVFEPATGRFAIAYFDRRLPLAPACYGEILALAVQARAGEAWPLRALAAEFPEASHARAVELKDQLAEVARDPANVAAIETALARYRVPSDDPEALERLDALVRRQHYRLAYWRVSADEINYRRFFDVNDLAGVRVEDAGVLAQTHEFVFELVASGKVQGLRIDHVDGLFNPTDYCTLLQDRAAALGHPQYLIVEKILARYERLRRDWRIAGTTGYDFMNLVNGVFVDADAELDFDRIYRTFAGITGTFGAFAYRAKKDIIRSGLASELAVLTAAFARIAESSRASRDFTANVLRDALVETVASFPVYRTYVTSDDVHDDDRRFIELALASARLRSDVGDESVFAFLEGLLLLRTADDATSDARRAVQRFAMKFQQYTSPVMAKAVEDTAFYRFVRLASLNEVGGDPRRFGTSVAEFHEGNAERAASHPHAMLATATHDHKRGEDTRTRIDALSEMPGLWARALERFGEHNAAAKRGLPDGGLAPTRNDEYFLYQTLVGTWPAQWLGGGAPDAAARDAYVERIAEYWRKALREAKFATSWTNPNHPYEDAALGFLRAIVAPEARTPFLRELDAVARECAAIGAVSSLAQVALKLTSPGVPDTYQGCELWDLSLVDPDNRRPVDYAAREAMLEDFERRLGAGDQAALASDLLGAWRDGRVKAYVTWRLLHLRLERRATYLGSSYAPLATAGARGAHVIAFARDGVLTVVPRLARRLLERDGDASAETGGVGAIESLRTSWSDETVRLRPQDAARFVDRLTGAVVEARGDGGERVLRVADVLGAFPVAVLEPLED